MGAPGGPLCLDRAALGSLLVSLFPEDVHVFPIFSQHPLSLPSVLKGPQHGGRVRMCCTQPYSSHGSQQSPSKPVWLWRGRGDPGIWLCTNSAFPVASVPPSPRSQSPAATSLLTSHVVLLIKLHHHLPGRSNQNPGVRVHF